MDIQLQTKISVLLEKIYYLQQSIQQNGSVVTKVDKDLLVNYVRELYELTLTMPVAAPPMYPAQNYPYQNPNPNQDYQQPYIPQGGYPQNQPQQPTAPQQPVAPQQNYPPTPPQQPYNQPTAYQPDNPFLQNEGFLNPLPGVAPTTNGNGANGSYGNGSTNGNVNGNGNANGNGKENGSNGQHLNAAFTFSNGKRSLSDSIKIKTANDKPSLNEQFKKQEPEFAGKMHKSPIKDLKTYIGLNKRFSYINYLFGNDAGLYDEAIEKINSCKTILEARKYIQNHLIPKLNWDDGNDMVGEFNTLVERRFAQ